MSGPFAVAGYRIGERGLKELGLPRGSFALEVVHESPSEVQWNCVVDGVQAATGASLGKLNLQLVPVPLAQMVTVIRNRKTGQELEFRLRPEFAKSFLNLPEKDLEAAGAKVAALPDEQIFSFQTKIFPTPK
jgi:formylmethanofuran dehydrogenase subunit E